LRLIYAVLDGCNNIDVHHLRAALEVWRYCQESVDYCFGGSSGSSTADRILAMLQSKPSAHRGLKSAIARQEQDEE
jgi:hypothetical protein